MHKEKDKITYDDMVVLRSEYKRRVDRNINLLNNYIDKIYNLPSYVQRVNEHKIKFSSVSTRYFKSVAGVTFIKEAPIRERVDVEIETGYLLTDDNVQYVLYEKLTDKTKNQTKVINVTRCDTDNDYAFVYEDITTKVPSDKQAYYLNKYSEVLDDKYKYDLEEECTYGYYIAANQNELVIDYANMDVERNNMIGSKHNKECKKLVKTKIK